MEPLLEIRGLRTHFASPRGPVKVLEGLDLSVESGTILGLVGESGSGKTVTAYSVLRLIRPPGRIVGGEVLFEGRDLLSLSESKMRRVRGREISMIFQDPRGFLDPVTRVGSLMREIHRTHESMSREEARRRSLDLLQAVGLPRPERVLRAYPHELSGGMAQRVMIALALASKPKLLIADEPTTALDVTIQIEIIRLLADLRERLGLTIVIITHNLSVVAEICDVVAVMYAGEIVEHTDVTSLFRRPLHPYTQGLIGSIPVVGAVQEELAVIPGNVPNLIDLPRGCRFAPRCATKIEEDVAIANEVHPLLRPVDPGHDVRCWVYHDAAGGLMPRGERGERIGPLPVRGESGFGA
jgi:oligopeptide/dipeptide ABC transporter ATP-binding protein